MSKLLSKALSPREIAARVGGRIVDIILADTGWVCDGRILLYAPKLAAQVKVHLLKRKDLLLEDREPDPARANKLIQGLMVDRYSLEPAEEVPDTPQVATIQKHVKNCTVFHYKRYHFGGMINDNRFYWFDGNECKAMCIP